MRHSDIVKENIKQLNNMNALNINTVDFLSLAEFDVKPIARDSILITVTRTKEFKTKYICAICDIDYACIYTFPFSNRNRLRNKLHEFWKMHGYAGHIIAEVIHE